MRTFQLTLMSLLLILTSIASADTNASVCKRSWSDMQSELRNIDNRIAFQNNGGIGNGGVCWWHSRFQRAAIYLTTFSPEKNKPSRAEARKIIHTLSHLSDVVEITGYSNFREFSADFQNEIQAELNLWQIRDGAGFAWVRGLWGKASLPADKMGERMEKIYSRFQEDTSVGHTLWFMEQMPGIVAHASLVIDMKPTQEGYELEVIDSNFPDESKFIQYSKGDKVLDGPSGDFVPYAGIERDNSAIQNALTRFCQN